MSGGTNWYGDNGRFMSEINKKLAERPQSHVIGDDGEPHPVYDGEPTVARADDPKGRCPLEAEFDDPIEEAEAQARWEDQFSGLDTQ